MDRYAKPTVIALAAVGLIIAFGYLVYLASFLFGSDQLSHQGLGAGLVLLALIGAWSTWQILRNGFELQRISRLAAENGCELDLSDLARRPSGRLTPEAADDLFTAIAEEYEADPHNWRTNYRLARAYDHAGDRPRGRTYMRTAVRLLSAEQKVGKAETR